MKQAIFLTKGTHTNSNIFDLRNKNVLKYLYFFYTNLKSVKNVKMFFYINYFLYSRARTPAHIHATPFILNTPLHIKHRLMKVINKNTGEDVTHWYIKYLEGSIDSFEFEDKCSLPRKFNKPHHIKHGTVNNNIKRK